MARNTTRLQYEQKMDNLLSKYWGALHLFQTPLKEGVKKVFNWFMSKNLEEIRKVQVLSGSE